MANFTQRLLRLFKKNPKYIVNRLKHEITSEAEALLYPLRERSVSPAFLSKHFNKQSIPEVWQWLSTVAYPFIPATQDYEAFEAICPGGTANILAKADDAMMNRVNLMGSGVVELGEAIQWNLDYKTGFSWPSKFMRHIEYNNPERSSDVKFPWELSRMQWMIPLGQAYLLTGDERYAIKARSLIEHWLANNPYSATVNWACTMDVAIRAMTWTWLFHAFCTSDSWSDQTFQFNFLRSLYLHGDFTLRHIERGDVNGNHYTADACGLVFIGMFFDGKGAASKWLKEGISILESEIFLQTFEDGVDFEASVPYHRLVQELFLLPHMYVKNSPHSFSSNYAKRLRNMAEFTASYSRNDGSIPLWGDADDARSLPMGSQPMNDHCYLLPIISIALEDKTFAYSCNSSLEEVFWLCGAAKTKEISSGYPSLMGMSKSFPDGGFFIMRNNQDHIFIDCGPLGLANRGGHGHNDILSFEAVLNGVHLISDCGAYLYTGNFTERNYFRSTAYHNTPQVDDQEINRFISADNLWNFHYDAVHTVHEWSMNSDYDTFKGSHTGYLKLKNPVTPIRTITLNHDSHALIIKDEFEGQGEHSVSIPLHLAYGVEVTQVSRSMLILTSGAKHFEVSWNNEAHWELQVTDGRISPTYGIIKKVQRLCWLSEGDLSPLEISIKPINKVN